MYSSYQPWSPPFDERDTVLDDKLSVLDDKTAAMDDDKHSVPDDAKLSILDNNLCTR